MTCIGLDVGTGFVKCVSDATHTRFPSLYAYRHSSSWEEKKGLIEAVGFDAAKISENPGTIVIRPVMQGNPVNERGFVELVRKAVELVSHKKDTVGRQTLEDLHIVAGLPYEARAQRDSIKRMILKLSAPKSCHVVPQAIGTLVDAGLSDAIIVSIGQGTTEIVAFQGRVPVKGVSSHHAVNDISSRLGTSKTSYLDDKIFGDSKARPIVDMLADSISDDLNSVRQDLKRLPVVISGGGILIPRMKEAIESRLSHDIITPKDPIMSNALGLYKLALEKC